MALEEYHRKRDFRRTPEPAGSGATKARRDGEALSFVVQKHAARRLHYDFRLELNGVLLSWAIPKGPSLDPAERRLAVRTEDHPIDYGGFEGVIPEGEYGGGTVLLWDRGNWTPEGPDPEADYHKGSLKFRLDGEKLHGGWALVRMGGRAAREGRENWLLIKERDKVAVPGSDTALVDDNPLSVATGRSIDDIAAERDRVWDPHHGRIAPEESSAKSGAAAPGSDPRPDPAPRAGGDGASGGAMKHIETEKSLPPQGVRRRGPRCEAKGEGQTGGESGIDISAPARDGSITFEGVRLTNPDRVLYPEQGITKLTLARYYAAIRDWILPELRNRPLSLVRCPEGQGEACFYQKHVGAGIPDVVGRVEIAEQSATRTYPVVENLPGLIAMAQIGVLELHPWGSTVAKLETPDRIIFDLDPDIALPWELVTEAAIDMREVLLGIGLKSFPKTTGGKGLHVVIPIAPQLEWDAVKQFSKWVAERFVTTYPDRYTSNMAKRARVGRIFIDYLRNSRGATAIAAYSPRARPGATVATPLFWEEVENGVKPGAFTIATVPGRLAGLDSDPWAEMRKLRQSISAHIRREAGI